LNILTNKEKAMREEEDICEDGKDHDPDWNTVTTEWDGDTLYVDVNCAKCGRSGCVGSVEQLKDNICW